jgi:hypothetical protein
MKRCAGHFGKTVEDLIEDGGFLIGGEESLPGVSDYVLELAARFPTLEEVNLISMYARRYRSSVYWSADEQLDKSVIRKQES